MMEDCFRHSSLTLNIKNMKTKTKYLLNVEGKKRYRGNTWMQLILNVLKGNHDNKRFASNKRS